MRDDTESWLDSLFPDIEIYSHPEPLEEKKTVILTINDILKLALSLEDKIDNSSARRMLLNHVEPSLKLTHVTLHQEAPLFLKLAQKASLSGDLSGLQSHLINHLKEIKNQQNPLIIENVGDGARRVIH